MSAALRFVLVIVAGLCCAHQYAFHGVVGYVGGALLGWVSWPWVHGAPMDAFSGVVRFFRREFGAP